MITLQVTLALAKYLIVFEKMKEKARSTQRYCRGYPIFCTKSQLGRETRQPILSPSIIISFVNLYQSFAFPLHFPCVFRVQEWALLMRTLSFLATFVLLLNAEYVRKIWLVAIMIAVESK